MQSFNKYLDERSCFKLICGAGNKNLQEITEICQIYASAGCRFFDVNASIEAIKSAKEGIKKAGKSHTCFICVSIGTKNDPHIRKYKRNPSKCKNCEACKKVCPNNAIDKEDYCIGCGRCEKICPNNAIEGYSKQIAFKEILPPIIKEGIDCIEYHIISQDEEEILKGWKEITEIYKGPISVCIDRSKLGNEKVIELLKTLKNKCNNLFIIQADGAPMSGGEDNYRTTLQAVATAELIEEAQITPYIFVSGGTNSNTKELINLFDINIAGIAIGSYARKIISNQENNELTKKILIAKNLIETSKKN